MTNPRYDNEYVWGILTITDATLPTTGPETKWYNDRFNRLMLVMVPFVTAGLYYLIAGI